jgi:hypothetical protein
LAFQQQAEQDWTRFLTSRARELTPGGKILIAAPGDAETGCISDGLYDVINDALADLVSAGSVTKEEYDRFTLPTYFRTLAESLGPLGKGAPFADAFSVDRAETMEVPVPFLDAFRSDRDVTAFASAYTGFIRAFSEPIVRSAFSRPGPEGDVADLLYDRIHARLLAEPNRYDWHYYQVALLLTRK